MNIPEPHYALCVVHAARGDVEQSGMPIVRGPSASIEPLVHRVRWPQAWSCVRAEEP